MSESLCVCVSVCVCVHGSVCVWERKMLAIFVALFISTLVLEYREVRGRAACIHLHSHGCCLTGTVVTGGWKDYRFFFPSSSLTLTIAGNLDTQWTQPGPFKAALSPTLEASDPRSLVHGAQVHTRHACMHACTHPHKLTKSIYISLFWFKAWSYSAWMLNTHHITSVY